MLDMEDLEALGKFIDQKIHSAIQRGPDVPEKTPEQAAADRASVVGVPDVPPDAGPLYYLHLANGDVVTSHDSASTHLQAGDSTQQIIGRFQVPPDALDEQGNLKTAVTSPGVTPQGDDGTPAQTIADPGDVNQ